MSECSSSKSSSNCGPTRCTSQECRTRSEPPPSARAEDEDNAPLPVMSNCKVPPFTVVIPLQLPPIWPAITSPISPELRKQLEKEQAPRPLLPRLENLPLPNGLTMMLDRSLTVRLDLATLWQKRVQQPDTYSLTLEAQSGSGWLWLTYRMPGTTAVPAPLSPLPREARLEK